MNLKYIEQIGLITTDHYLKHNIVDQITYACADKKTGYIWISYNNKGVITCVERNNKSVIKTLQIKANWFIITNTNKIISCCKKNNIVEIHDTDGNFINSFHFESPISIADAGDSLIIAHENPNGFTIVNFLGEVQFTYIPPNGLLKTPGNVISSKYGFLISDRFSHVIFKYSKGDEQNVFYGIKDKPQSKDNHLCAPHCITFNEFNETFVICDTLNGRIIECDYDGVVQFEYGNSEYYGGGIGHLWGPTYAEYISNNELFICDSKNNRIIIIDKNRNIKWEYGDALIEASTLKLPRTIMISEEKLFIADTHHNKIVITNMDGDTIETIERADGINFLFPRHIGKCTEGLLIADSGNNRIICLDNNKELVYVINELIENETLVRLSDPHYICEVNKTQLLLVDSGSDSVLLIDKKGCVLWRYSNLNDPHCLAIDKEDYIIADTKNNRLVILDQQGRLLNTIYQINGCKLIEPRFVLADHKYLIVVDNRTDDRRIIITNREDGNHFVCEFVDEPLQALNHVRSLALHEDYLYISDTGNSRIMKVKIIT